MGTIVAVVLVGLGYTAGRASASGSAGNDVVMAPSSTSTTVPATLVNPVLPVDFPDPDITRLDDGTYLAVATNSGDRKLQLSTSSDLATWSPPVDALVDYPAWAHPRNPDLWAPTHVAHGDRHLVFFSLRSATSGRHCIAVAESASATGPYQAREDPVLCSDAVGGVIDPSVYEDASGAYLLWKDDGNCCGLPSVLRSQPIDLDTMTLTGEPQRLLDDALDWELGVVEAPELVATDDHLFLVYSGGSYADAAYGVGVASCATPSGPCQRVSEFPILSSTTAVKGPGGQSVFDGPDGLLVAYHAWSADAVGYPQGGTRSMRIDAVQVVGDQLVVLGPTAGIAVEIGP